MREGLRPATVAERMNLDPDSVPRLVQLQRAGTVGEPEMPMPAAWAPREFALALNDQSSLTTFFEDFPCRQLEIEFEHGWY